jgi:hypothetical protein
MLSALPFSFTFIFDPKDDGASPAQTDRELQAQFPYLYGSN